MTGRPVALLRQIEESGSSEPVPAGFRRHERVVVKTALDLGGRTAWSRANAHLSRRAEREAGACSSSCCLRTAIAQPRAPA